MPCTFSKHYMIWSIFKGQYDGKFRKGLGLGQSGPAQLREGTYYETLKKFFLPFRSLITFLYQILIICVWKSI